MVIALVVSSVVAGCWSPHVLHDVWGAQEGADTPLGNDNVTLPVVRGQILLLRKRNSVNTTRVARRQLRKLRGGQTCHFR